MRYLTKLCPGVGATCQCVKPPEFESLRCRVMSKSHENQKTTWIKTLQSMNDNISINLDYMGQRGGPSELTMMELTRLKETKLLFSLNGFINA